MVQSVKVLPKEIQDVIEVRIWNVKELEGIKRKKELRARAVPSIAIDYEVVFQSGIPQHEELIAAITKRLGNFLWLLTSFFPADGQDKSGAP